MSPTTVNGVACACGQTFSRFSTWEAHRAECECYE
jgi:hypothetical protein